MRNCLFIRIEVHKSIYLPFFPSRNNTKKNYTLHTQLLGRNLSIVFGVHNQIPLNLS